MTYDALLVLSFGGPEGPDDVMPFLDNVTRGRGIPRERLLTVAEHYLHFGGVSPINGQVRELLDALRAELAGRNVDLPIYWGNRNWHPMLEDTIARMRTDGVKHALALSTSAWGGYSGCRQYLEDIARARTAVGDGAPLVDKLPPLADDPGFLGAQAARVIEACAALDEAPRLVFTAHSIPVAAARTSMYEAQVREASRRVAERVDPDLSWELAWQSRSGPPEVPWLSPDVLEVLDRLASEAPNQPIVLVPIGFLSDHMEVVWDLDHEARQRAEERGLRLVRAGTVGTHPRFVQGLADLVTARLAHPEAAATLATCGPTCCPAPLRRPSAR